MNTYKKVNKTEGVNLCRIVSDNTPSFSGVVSGISKGVIYLSNIKKPKAAIVYSEPVGGYSILGNLDTDEEMHELYQFLRDQLFPDLRKRKRNYFEFSINDTNMQEKFLSLFCKEQLNTELEYTLRMGLEQAQDVSIPDDYEIVPINAEFLHKLDKRELYNSSLILDILHNSWNTYHKFLTWSLGYAAVYQNQVVATIIGTSRFHQYVPIDIITEEKHRNKGLASAMTLAFTKECRERGLIAHWDCVESNIASQKTAKKCGFELLRQRSYYWFSI